MQLAREGCHLALSDVNEATLAETRALVAALANPVAAANPAAAAPGSTAAPISITTARVDVSSRDEVFAWAAQVAREHGRVNLIFNNAGVAIGATAEGITPEDFHWILGINFWGVVHGTQAFLPHLRASGEGHVVNVSSLFGLIAVPGQSAYNASKFAVRGFTESLRQELDLMRSPVSATCVHPGGVKTSIARSSRVSQSLRELGQQDPEAATRQFEVAFRTTAGEAAAQILRGVRRNARRVLVGADARALDLLQRLLPSAYQRLSVLAARRFLRGG